MHIEKYRPCDLLKPFVQTYMIVESEFGMDSHVLPGTSLVLAFRCRGTVASDGQDLPGSMVTGLRKSRRILRYSPQAATLLVAFTEGGASAFFSAPLHELFGETVALENLIPRHKLNRVEGLMAEAATDMDRIRLAEQFLCSELKTAQMDLLILEAVGKIRMSGGNQRIHDLAADLHLSLDSFEKRFRRAVGASPKQFSSIVRLRNVIGGYLPDRSLSETAHAAGYFDQSHFIKDFQTFTGAAPKEFFQSGSYW
ncbi:MAG: transcriptional regulator, AraC family [Capsulimonas sp.]|jgi:methylphosphotriester-DNA--protein-cysteine methyltransferase|nr:transcriptional regulator, AraC family [Capsulimonas sp.]